MPIDDHVRESAERFWKRITGIPSLGGFRSADQFSPSNFRAIEAAFESDRERRMGGLLEMPSQDGHEKENALKVLAFELGAYIGEIVRHHYGEKCKWVFNPDSRDDCGTELYLPDKDEPLFPIRFATDQLKEFQPGNFVKWAEAAGLRVGNHPTAYRPHFGS